MIIGVTGGIGSGKSTACDYLREKGYPIIDADEVSRRIVMPGSECLDTLADAFGEDIILEDGTLDRRELGIRAFADDESKQLLDSIMMDAIIGIMQEDIAEYEEEGHSVIIVDAPLLFETGFDEHTDQVWLVDAPDDVRIERVMKRSGISRQEVEDRISRQMPQEEKRRMADHVLDNSGSREDLIAQMDELLKDIIA